MAGQKIADGGGADILAPADGRVGEVCRRPLAGDEGRNADCIILYETLAAPPLPVESGATFAETLKKAGIVGLGGGGFPGGTEVASALAAVYRQRCGKRTARFLRQGLIGGKR